MSFDDERFRISAEQAADVRKGVPTTPQKGDSKNKTADNIITPEKVAAVNLTREPPALRRTIDTSISKLRLEIKKVVSIAASAMDEFASHPAELKSSDRALLSFCRSVQFRHETGVRCAGKGSVDQSGSSSLGPDQAQPGSPCAMSTLTGGEMLLSPNLLEARKKLSFKDFLAEPPTSKNKFWEGELEHLREIPECSLAWNHCWRPLLLRTS